MSEKIQEKETINDNIKDMTPSEFYDVMREGNSELPELKHYQRMILDNGNRIIGPVDTYFRRMIDPSIDQNAPRLFVDSIEGSGMIVGDCFGKELSDEQIKERLLHDGIELCPLPKGTGKTAFMTEMLANMTLEDEKVILAHIDNIPQRLIDDAEEMKQEDYNNKPIIIDSLVSLYSRGNNKTGPFLEAIQQAFSMHPAPPKELPLTRTEKRKQQRKRAKERAREMKELRKEFIKESAREFIGMFTSEDGRPMAEVSNTWKREVIPGGEHVEHHVEKVVMIEANKPTRNNNIYGSENLKGSVTSGEKQGDHR